MISPQSGNFHKNLIIDTIKCDCLSKEKTNLGVQYCEHLIIASVKRLAALSSGRSNSGSDYIDLKNIIF